MLQRFLQKYTDRFVSRWMVLAIDVISVVFSFVLAYLLRFNFEISEIKWEHLRFQLPFVTFLYLGGFLAFRSYTGIVRHTSLADAIRIGKASVFASVVSCFISLSVRTVSVDTPVNIPLAVIFIHFFIILFTLISSRLFIKALFSVAQNSKEKTKVLIYGAGASGIITKNTLLQDTLLNYEVVGFVDDNPSKIGKTIEGVKVYSPNYVLGDYLDSNNIAEVIISIQRVSAARKREIVDSCLDHNVKIKNVPPLDSWINGSLSATQIKKVKIEDLLERPQIKLDNKEVHNQLKGKCVMITGAAGSIGSEIVRQVQRYAPAQLVLVDQAETPMYDLEQEISNPKNNGSAVKKEYVITDVTNKERLEKSFQQFKPDVVFHAAAYKHVPLMENNPYEAILVNVFGTKNVADLAAKYGANKFVMVSTDKAVNPTNVMGASKRVAEIYTQSLNKNPDVKTKYITTRFGNVLGSNGSVIPLFKRQIEAGGPLTVTHPDITRYFMTIPEACQLVIEAGAMGKGGEVFVFDMGESVKIFEVAKKMIQLSGLVYKEDIDIEITGLRPGEKLYEELLTDKESTMSTHHPKIMIAEVPEYDCGVVCSQINELDESLQTNDNVKLVSKIKAIVPEFVSNNSEYSKLDVKTEIIDE